MVGKEREEDMLEKEKLETYLSLCMKSEADYAEVFEESTKSESISMLNGETESVSVNTSSGVGIRLYKGFQTV